CYLVLAAFRRTLNPHLFPYTTLFRSLGEIGLEPAVIQKAALHRLVDKLQPFRAFVQLVQGEDILHRRGLLQALEDVVAQQDVLADRKSTRLNSSNAKISYAVFCLKKT